MISRVIAGWPAVALLIAVKLLSGILEHRDPAAVAAAMVTTQTVRAVHVPTPASSTPPSDHSRPANQSRIVPAVASVDDPAALEHAARDARDARDELHREGRPLTRDALAARLRATGYPVRNATLTPLLAALRAEPASPA
jgi:hypothetical protein